MDYEKKYKELVGKIEKAYLYAQTDSTKAVLEEIRPELKSEDERIRKAIIDFFSEPGRKEYILKGFTVDDILAWLEKQGDKDKLIKELGEYKVKYTPEVLENHLKTMNKEDERLRKTTIAFLKDFADKGYENAVECIDWLGKQGEQKAHLELKAGKWYICHRAYCCRADHLTVKEGERFLCEEDGVVNGYAVTEPEKYFREVSAPIEATAATYTTEVETGNGGIKALVTEKVVMPKFKVGDWVTDGIFNCKITDVLEDRYIVTSKYEKRSAILFEHESRYHLWTIEDAKPGDILCTSGFVFQFKEIRGDGGVSYYCANEKELHEGDDSTFHIAAKNSLMGYANTGLTHYEPATKEQRDLLFSKMKEAGYVCDAEKLEPIKVPKTKEPEGALKKLLDEQDKLYKEAKIVLEDKDTALAFLKRMGIIDEYGELADKYRSDQTPATTISAVNGSFSIAISDGNTSVTSKEVEAQYCTGQYEPDVRELPIEWKQENVDELSEFERAMMHIGGSFFGEKAGLDPNNTNDVKEQAKFLLELAPKQEWSEEDEKYLQELIEWIDCFIDDEDCGDMTYDEHKEFYTTRINWLKSLKDRVQPQPKQEWSEEDEKKFCSLLNTLTRISSTTRTDTTSINYSFFAEINWLKSLKQRYTWKPSDTNTTSGTSNWPNYLKE